MRRYPKKKNPIGSVVSEIISTEPASPPKMYDYPPQINNEARLLSFYDRFRYYFVWKFQKPPKWKSL